jgi:hypothetical protein
MCLVLVAIISAASECTMLVGLARSWSIAACSRL